MLGSSLTTLKRYLLDNLESLGRVEEQDCSRSTVPGEEAGCTYGLNPSST